MTTALVLGGGGVAGIAWEFGVLAELARGGVDLTGADLVVGTSAGSVVGALVTAGTPLEELCARQEGPTGTSGELAIEADMGELFERYLEVFEGDPAPQAVRARIGAMALATPTVDEADRRAVIEARLDSHDWPDRELVVTAVDAVTGEFVPFDRRSGVELVAAVGASCAVPGIWPPVTIDGRRFIDGGIRTTANVDLAAGHDVVVVLAPMPAGFGEPFEDQIAALPRRRIDGRGGDG